jgi:CubicO group peptidase (beta-lactamase class C family)
MTTNALPPGIRFAGHAKSLVGPQAGSTWGLGFAIRNDPAWSLVPGSVGSFFWLGAGGTYFWIDPAEQLITIQLIQISPNTGLPFHNTFRNLTYGAFSIPGQGVAAAGVAPVTIDAAALAAYAGIYAFTSTNSRDRQDRSTFGGLGINVAMQKGGIYAVAAIPNAAAARAGVQAGDTITRLDDEATQGMDLDLRSKGCADPSTAGFA